MRRLAQTFERSHPSCEAIEGRCKVRKKSDLLSCDAPTIYEHVFFCEYMYDPHKGSLKQVYVKAKECSEQVSMEKFANVLAKHFTSFYQQGSSGINRFNQSFWSKVQCEMILAFLSFADYYRPKYFLLDNVRNFVSLNKGQTFCLAIASLLEMGYQVRFGILEAGAFGVPQSWKRLYGQHLLKKLSRSG